MTKLKICDVPFTRRGQGFTASNVIQPGKFKGKRKMAENVLFLVRVPLKNPETRELLSHTRQKVDGYQTRESPVKNKTFQG